MPQPIALQLYTLREDMAKDFAGTVRKVADLGYAGVETAGVYGGSPRDAAKLFTELGLTVCSAHLPLPLGEKQNEVLDTAAALDCKYIVPGGTPRDMKTVDAVKRACDQYNEASVIAQQHSRVIGVHNHWWEFEKVEDGRPIYEVMQAYLDPHVVFEVDVYWAQTAGYDPATLVRNLGGRAPLLHIKDGPCVRDQPMTALGEGVVDIEAVVKAGGDSTAWLIVELDACATDMITAVEKSYVYLIGKGLARGRKN
jgi:sugar phosphate isomerase/epimerase